MYRESKWILKHRGQAALDYLNFQRMLIIIGLITSVISLIAGCVNFFAGFPVKEEKNTSIERTGAEATNTTSGATYFVDRTSHAYMNVRLLQLFNSIILLPARVHLQLVPLVCCLPSSLHCGGLLPPPTPCLALPYLGTHQVCSCSLHQLTVIFSTLVIRGLDPATHTAPTLRC